MGVQKKTRYGSWLFQHQIRISSKKILGSGTLVTLPRPPGIWNLNTRFQFNEKVEGTFFQQFHVFHGHKLTCRKRLIQFLSYTRVY